MFVLHVELKVKSGAQANLEKTFVQSFYPAISGQGGFLTAQLLHSTDDSSTYRLCLSFDQRDSQQKWVATDLHQQVWPLVEDLCESYAVSGYTAI